MRLNPELTSFLDEINSHNLAIYNSTPISKKVDFSKTKVNWGTSVIDPKFFIDITKPVKTFDGMEVTGLQLVLHNSTGQEVTFPLKGTILVKQPGKTTKMVYQIWTLDGRVGVGINDFEHKHNIFNPQSEAL